MRRIYLATAAVLLMLATVAQAGDTYRVTVTRIDSDLYREYFSKALITTRFCFEYVNMDSAVLKWDGSRYGNNWIVFSSGEKCDVIGVHVP